MVTEGQGEQEEDEGKHESERGQSVDEMFQLFRDGRLEQLDGWSQSGNSSHDCAVANVDDHSNGVPVDSVSSKER